MYLLPERQLFAAWCGMIQSGYDLWDRNDVFISWLCERIQSLSPDEEISRYFAWTRTNAVAVNPYYPRGSDLSVACFFLGRPLEEYVCFLRRCGSSSADDASFLEWIQRLPQILARIEEQAEFGPLYDAYCQEAERRFELEAKNLERLQSKLEKLSKRNLHIAIVLNFLQSPYLVDFAVQEDALYVITEKPRPMAIVHEYLHVALQPMRTVLREIMTQKKLSSFVDTAKMQESGYMQDGQEDSGLHALEDCFVRALSGLLDECVDPEEYCRRNEREGFVAVGAMLQKLRSCRFEAMSLEEILWFAAEFDR